MTLNEAIKHCEEVISQCKEGTACALEHKQLRDWLTKLKSYEEIKEKKGMKPFDLEKAKSGKPVCTRDGREARILCSDLKDEAYPIVAAVLNNNGVEDLIIYTSEGKEYIDSTISRRDLVMPTIKKEGWINLYSDTHITCSRTVYKTKEEAFEKHVRSSDYIDTVKIEWEE